MKFSTQKIKKRGFPTSTRGSLGRKAIAQLSFSFFCHPIKPWSYLVPTRSHLSRIVDSKSADTEKLLPSTKERTSASILDGWEGTQLITKLGKTIFWGSLPLKIGSRLVCLPNSFCLFLLFLILIRRHASLTLLADCKTMAVWERNYKALLWQKNKRDAIVWHVEVAPML